MEVVAGADAPASRGPQALPCGLEIAGRRNLDVRRIAFDDVDPVPRLLRQHRFIRRVHPGAPECNGGA